jgi:hypothetical protein
MASGATSRVPLCSASPGEADARNAASCEEAEQRLSGEASGVRSFRKPSRPMGPPAVRNAQFKPPMAAAVPELGILDGTCPVQYVRCLVKLGRVGK